MIDCEHADRGFTVWSSEPAGTEIRGLTIANGLSDDGGGVTCQATANLLLNECWFRNCDAERGGALYFNQATVEMRNCFVTDCFASLYGGGILCRLSTLNVNNCTVVDNYASNASGGIHVVRGSTAYLANSIVYGNEAPEGADVSVQNAANFSNCTVDYCVIAGGAAAVNLGDGCELNWGDGNLSDDPQLTGDGRHLQSASPCRNAGDPAGDFAGQSDIDGETRVHEERVDIGADEFIDTDADGLPDWWETLYFGDAEAADANGDEDEDGERNIDEYIAAHNPLLSQYYCFIDQMGNDNWDGRSPVWDGVHGPKRTLRGGLTVADGETVKTVLLADGTYAGPDNRELDFEGKAITVRSANGPETCVIDCEREGIAFHFRNGETNESRLEGLTITRTTANVAGYLDAAVVCEEGSAPTISGCCFDRCAGAVTCAGLGEGEEVGTVQIADCQVVHSMHTVTIIDHGKCEVRNCTFTSNSPTPGYGVLIIAGELNMNTCTVSGFRYGVRGYGVGSDDCFMQGSLYLTNCTIENCSLSISSSYVGVCVSCADVVEIKNCTIRNNNGYGYSGITAYGTSVLIENCLIDGNHASSNISGLRAGYYGDHTSKPEVIIRSCEVTNNTSLLTTGIRLNADRHDGYLLIEDCMVSGNLSEYGSAGISVYGLHAGCNANISTCIVADNVSQNSIISATMDPHAGNISISDSLVCGNTIADENSEQGIINCSYGQNMELTDCIIVGNYLSNNAPAIETKLTETLHINGNLIYGNDLGAAESIIAVSQGDSSITNNIIWNNVTAEGVMVHYDEATGNDVFLNNDIEGGAAAIVADEGEFAWDASNIDAAPLLFDPDGPDDDPATWEDNDYRLSGGSPCIDAGHNGYVSADVLDLDDDGDVEEPLPFDFAGAARFVDDAGMPDNGDDGGTGLAIVDMGPFEFAGETCYGDLTGDGRVSLNDLAHLLGRYGEPAGMTYANGDLDRDGDVDLSDLTLVLGLYGNECP